MEVGLIGVNHKLADLKLRESLAKACEKRFLFQEGEYKFVILSTCNRTEIYFSSPNLAETHSYTLEVLRQEVKGEFDHQLYTYFGQECFYHLCRVAAGLDSACVAETEIQGQVKNSYEKSRNDFNLSYDLHYLFQKALNIGKQIRFNLNIPKGIPDFEDAVYETAALHFPDVRNTKILFIGASTINKKLITFLEKKGLKHIRLFTRTALDLPIVKEPRLENWVEYDWIICGAKSNVYLINEAPRAHEKLIIDLSVPRNVNPDVGNQITLYNIDQIDEKFSTRHRQLKAILEDADDLALNLSRKHFELFTQKRESRLHLVALTA